MDRAEHAEASGLPNEGQVCPESPLSVPRAPVGRSWRALECSEKPRDFQARKWGSWGRSAYGVPPSGSQVSTNPGSWWPVWDSGPSEDGGVGSQPPGPGR